MTRTERLLRLARLRGDRAAELILLRTPAKWRLMDGHLVPVRGYESWTEAELRAAWGDR